MLYRIKVTKQTEDHVIVEADNADDAMEMVKVAVNDHSLQLDGNESVMGVLTLTYTEPFTRQGEIDKDLAIKCGKFIGGTR